MKKRRDESQSDLDENFNVAEEDTSSLKHHDEADVDEDDEVSELGQGDMVSGDFGVEDDESIDDM